MEASLAFYLMLFSCVIVFIVFGGIIYKLKHKKISNKTPQDKWKKLNIQSEGDLHIEWYEKNTNPSWKLEQALNKAEAKRESALAKMQANLEKNLAKAEATRNKNLSKMQANLEKNLAKAEAVREKNLSRMQKNLGKYLRSIDNDDDF